ncbi:hypothetical protein QL285_034844 [Trifolium repens]|nr:hypothetical protein QL285_034844 [Trifolium repens]
MLPNTSGLRAQVKKTKEKSIWVGLVELACDLGVCSSLRLFIVLGLLFRFGMHLHQIKPSHPGFNQSRIYICGSKKLGKSDIGRWIDAELAIPRRRRVLSMLGLEGREYIECGRNCDRQIHLSQMCSRLRWRYLVFNFPPKSKIRLFEFQIGKFGESAYLLLFISVITHVRLVFVG